MAPWKPSLNHEPVCSQPTVKNATFGGAVR